MAQFFEVHLGNFSVLGNKTKCECDECKKTKFKFLATDKCESHLGLTFFNQNNNVVVLAKISSVTEFNESWIQILDSLEIDFSNKNKHKKSVIINLFSTHCSFTKDVVKIIQESAFTIKTIIDIEIGKLHFDNNVQIDVNGVVSSYKKNKNSFAGTFENDKSHHLMERITNSNKQHLIHHQCCMKILKNLLKSTSIDPLKFSSAMIGSHNNTNNCNNVKVVTECN
jgi:hypothetical protein